MPKVRVRGFPDGRREAGSGGWRSRGGGYELLRKAVAA